ncbi:hypothetical protein HYR99_36585 [Candidatus Poribacteria bacterium]|nr:hypothetical protein [Candidatus Poribacteria bacterium]
MTLGFPVRHYANFFHFVSHLAETPPHPYRQVWLQETGVLTQAEEAALSDFNRLMKQYPIDSKPPEKGHERFLQKPFTHFEDEQVWEEVRKWVDTASDFEGIKRIFATLEPRFEEIWKKEQPLLEGWKKELRQLIPLDVHARIAEDLHVFHQSISTGEQLDVYLLFSLEYRFGGSAEVGADSITLQCSRAPRDAWGHNLVLWTLYHEWTHNFQWEYLLGLILDFVKEIDEADFSRSEAAQETGGLIGFFIEGLARLVGSDVYRRHYPSIAKSSSNSQLDKPQKILLNHLIGEYLKSKKPVDVKFLKEFWRISRDANYDVL